jgi:hypothetical protein
MVPQIPDESSKPTISDASSASARESIASRLPRAVLGAGVLATAGFVVAAIHASILLDLYKDVGITIGRVGSGLFYVCLAYFSMSSVRRKRGWVRWILIAWGVLNLVGLLGLFQVESSLEIRIASFSQALLFIFAAILLALPTSGRWFAKRARDMPFST